MGGRINGQNPSLKTWQYTHTNNRLFLPYPPVTNVREVKLRGKVLAPEAYQVNQAHWRTTVEVPFSWKKGPLAVTYEAGYGDDFQDIPLSLQQAVLTTIACLYKNRTCNKVEGLSLGALPWIQYHRTYHMSDTIINKLNTPIVVARKVYREDGLGGLQEQPCEKFPFGRILSL